MSNTRVGKIGRLPKYIRDELGRRIEDGELGKELVKWMNNVPYVQEILKEQFGGRPITEQNLSEWKQTGHPEWLRREETCLLAVHLTEHSDDLDEAADGQEISDRFANVLAAEMARLATVLLEKETDTEKRWQRLCEVHRELSQLRRDDHRAVRTLMERQRWNRQVEGEDIEADKRFDKEDRERRIAPYFAMLEHSSMAKLFGGSDAAKDIAAFILEMQHNLPVGRLGRNRESNPSEPTSGNPGKSNLIQPNPTNLPNGYSPAITHPETA